MGKLIAADRFKEIPGDNEDDMDRFTRKKNAGTLAPRTPANSHHGLQSMHIRKVMACNMCVHAYECSSVCDEERECGHRMCSACSHF